MRTVCALFVIVPVLLGAVRAEALCVQAPKANLRVGPGTDYKVGWTVYRYFPFEKVGTSLSGDWYAVEDVDGDVLWIHKSLVTTGHRCAAVTSPKVNVRTGPGTRYRRLFRHPVEKYSSFLVLETRGDWVKVKDMDGNTGWVNRGHCVIR